MVRWALAISAGLKGPVVWYMSSLVNGCKGGYAFRQYDGKCDNWDEQRDLANLKAIVQEVQKRRKAKGWPEIIYMTVDEAGTQTENRRIRSLRMGTILPKTLKVVHELGARAALLLNPPPLKVLDNPDFENPANQKEPLPGWDFTRQPGVEIRLDQANRHGGNH